MKHSHLTAATLLTAALALSTTGCAAGQAESPEEGAVETAAETPAENTEMAAEPVKTTAQLAAAAYREALADPLPDFKIDESITDSARFSYSLVNIAEGDIPQMLVKASGDLERWNNIDFICAYSYDPDSDSLIVSDSVPNGLAGGGGFRGVVEYSAYGNGLIRNEWSPSTGEGTTSRITVEDGNFVETIVMEFQPDTDSAVHDIVNKECREISWLDAADPAALDALEAGEWQTTATETPDMAEAAREAGLSTYTGTIRLLDADSVCELQEREFPWETDRFDGVTYVILDLGGEQQVTAQPGGGGQDLRTANAQLLLLSRSSSSTDVHTKVPSPLWSNMDGRVATVAIDPKASWWPSDVDIPLGQPRCVKNFIIIG